MNRVKENPAFVRVSESIVNTDNNAYRDFLEKRKSEKALELKVNQLESKLDLILKKLGIENG